MSKVTTSELADAIAKAVEEYSQEVTDEVKRSVIVVTKECLDDIRNASPVLTGSYRKGWRSKVVYDGKTDIRSRIYNATDYQLTHLLEYGHAKANGGRTEPIPHIAPAEQKAAEKLQNKIKVGLR